MIKLVKVKQEFYDLCKLHGVDRELLHNEHGRPCVLLVRLCYKGQFCDFVVPLRSNISETTPVEQYFSLPPNPHTRPFRRHGLHYCKLFPIKRQYLDLFKIDGNAYYLMILEMLRRHESEIISNCQSYLNQYELGRKYFVTPDIDAILSVLS